VVGKRLYDHVGLVVKEIGKLYALFVSFRSVHQLLLSCGVVVFHPIVYEGDLE
jgi:transposase-like protein